MAIAEHITEATIREVFNGDLVTLDIKSLSVTDQAGLICLVGLDLEQQPNKSNKFISFLQNEFDPIMAVYGYYWSVDRKMLKLSSRNFQSTMLFEQEFGYLIKHLTPEKTQALFSSVQDGVNLAKIELELTSPFNIQSEDEIGTGTWEHPEIEIPEDDVSQSTPKTQQEIDELRDDFVKNAKSILSDLIFTDVINTDDAIDRIINKLDDQTAYDMLVAHYAEHVPELEETHNTATHPVIAAMQQSAIDAVKAAYNKVKRVASTDDDDA